MNLLEVNDLEVFYGHINALRKVSLHIRGGEIFTLIGSNGAGKTTLLNTITGVVPAARGSVRYQGQDITNERSDLILIAGIAHVPEGRKIFSELSVEENLLAGAYTIKDKHEVKRLMDRSFELFPRLAERRKQQGATLSGGEQQMLAIARGLMSEPQLLLLDEPSLGLAPNLVETIFELITEINDMGMTIFLVEQNANMALEIASFGFVLENGEIRISGRADKLMKDDEVKKAYLGIA